MKQYLPVRADAPGRSQNLGAVATGPYTKIKQLLKLHAYEQYESHFLQHERLRLEAHNLKLSLAAGTATDKQSLIEAMRGWLIVHIQTADKALAEYLSTRGAQPGT